MSCIDRAGWFSGLLSAVKLYQSVSISGPSAISKPIEAKIASIRSSAWLTGWMPPVPRLRPGKVTSSDCAASWASSWRLASSARRSTSADSIACLAALISAPRAFFSSGEQRAERLQLLGDPARLAEIARLRVLELGARRRAGEVGPGIFNHRREIAHRSLQRNRPQSGARPGTAARTADP